MNINLPDILFYFVSTIGTLIILMFLSSKIKSHIHSIFYFIIGGICLTTAWIPLFKAYSEFSNMEIILGSLLGGCASLIMIALILIFWFAVILLALYLACLVLKQNFKQALLYILRR
jgi:hypothetical protein